VQEEAKADDKSADLEPEASSALEVIEEMSNESSIRNQVEEVLQKRRLGSVTKEELLRQG